MSLGFVAVIVAAGAAILAVVGLAYLSIVLAWEDQRTRGTSYYGLSPAERERFKRTLRRHALFLTPILRVLGRVSKPDLARATFRYDGASGPKGTCSVQSFADAVAYVPQSEDVFVATQMKCGTTWMQHLVYQIVLRGQGDLVEMGRTLYATSPWLESLKSVSVTDAPVVGAERPTRIIKTHLPAPLCPHRPEARYVYVARHPVSCFASCADFLAGNLGPFCPDLEAIEEWFCSDDLMWWGTWPAHVDGWWDLSRQRDNVLFVHFEGMKRDLSTVVRRVTSFLGMAPLTHSELEDVLTKCGFEYMQRHSIAFEMHPPHILARDTNPFVRGTADRHRDVPGEARTRIMDWCTTRMAESAFPLSEVYPSGEATRQPPGGPV